MNHLNFSREDAKKQRPQRLQGIYLAEKKKRREKNEKYLSEFHAKPQRSKDHKELFLAETKRRKAVGVSGRK